MGRAYTAKPDADVVLNYPDGWNPEWVFPGPFPPGYEVPDEPDNPPDVPPDVPPDDPEVGYVWRVECICTGGVSAVSRGFSPLPLFPTFASAGAYWSTLVGCEFYGAWTGYSVVQTVSASEIGGIVVTNYSDEVTSEASVDEEEVGFVSYADGTELGGYSYFQNSGEQLFDIFLTATAYHYSVSEGNSIGNSSSTLSAIVKLYRDGEVVWSNTYNLSASSESEDDYKFETVSISIETFEDGTFDIEVY